MTSPPDKFFQEHLESYQKPAPPSAWERIDTGLRRRNLFRRWLTMVTGIILLVAGVVILWPPAVPVSETTPIESNTDPVLPPPVEQNQIIPAPSDHPIQSRMPDVKPETGKRKKTVIPMQKDMAVQTESLPATDEMPTPASVAATEVKTTSPPVVQQIRPEAIEEPIVIPSTRLVYSAAEVESRFMKKSSTSQATPESKNPSGLKKVIDIAASIKHDDGTYGDLRQKKNEILSLGFLDSKSEADKK